MDQTMDQVAALKKINEIHQVIEGNNKAVLSGESMIANGVLVTLIPLIEYLTNYMTFGVDLGPHAGMIVTLIHTAVYWALFAGLGRLMSFKKLRHSQTHPLLVKAFSLWRPFVLAIVGVIFVLATVEQGQLIHPLVFILLGLLYSLYGRFTIPAVSYIAWSYIVLGLIYVLLTPYHIAHLWIFMTVYNGLSYVVMGLFLRKEQAKG